MRKPNTSLRDDEAPLIRIPQLLASRILRLADGVSLRPTCLRQAIDAGLPVCISDTG